MNFTVDKEIKLGYFLALVILVISYILLFLFTSKEVKNGVVENSKIRIGAEEKKLLSAFNDLENGYHSYLLIGNKESLDLLSAGKKNLEFELEKIKSISGKDSQQSKKLDALTLAIAEEINTMHKGIVLYQKDNFMVTDSLKQLLIINSQQGVAIRYQLNEMQFTQYQLPNDNSTSDNIFSAIKAIMIVGSMLTFFMIFFYFKTYAKENSFRKIAAEQAYHQQKVLEDEVKMLSGANDQLTESDSVEKFAASGRMARMIAHEVRNPLTNIGLANDQLKDVVELNEESSMLLNMIKRNGERINLLIGDLLNATKFGELHCKNVSINNLLDEVLSSLNPQILEQHIDIQRDYVIDPCAISADPEKMRIVFYNVILNSIESIKSLDGVLKISTAITDGQCVIKIIDNGAGINETSLPKLFEPFYTSKNKGNGLGLTNAQNIVLNHKGKIKAESTEGVGTCFTIGIPCSA